MSGTIYIGLGVSSHTTSATAAVTFDNVTIAAGTPVSPTALPSPWTHQDVGAVGAAGNAWYAASTSTVVVKGAGADIYGTADAFHFVYQPLNGDGTITARVTGVQNTNAWVKAGVMIRETLDPGSAQGLMHVSYSKGQAFQRRTVGGGASTSTAGPISGAPYWVRVRRIGSTITAYSSPDGATWTQVGTDTIAMGSNVLVGLAVSSHTTATAAQVTFDNVTVSQP
jgi:regulation of enolase protein 1 (concanavalin A-like superfamily)